MSEKTALVIADIFKLAKIDGKFNKDTKYAKPKNLAHLITREYADEMNRMWESTGIKCVIDEEASLEAADKIIAAAKVRLKNDKARETAARALTSMALTANNDHPEEDEEPVGSMAYSVKELKELESLKDMNDVELDEFFKTEERATGKALLGELITGNN